MTCEYAWACIIMRHEYALLSARPGFAMAAAVKATIWSGARCHVGGEDVVRVAVEVLACPVIPHRGTRVGVAGGDLDVAQVHPRVEHGRDKCMPADAAG
jgi:hypothetical protein